MISAWSLTLCATAISRVCSVNRFRGTFGVRPEFTPVEIREAARLESLFVAHDIDPGAGWITDRLRTRADDVERSVVVLDVCITEPHVLVGAAAGQRHSDRHARGLRTRRRNAGRSQATGLMLAFSSGAPTMSRSPTDDALSGVAAVIIASCATSGSVFGGTT